MDFGETKMRSRLLSAAVAACALLLAGPVSAQGVKIGILNDQSGVYADYGGKYSFEAAKMAVEDFGGSVLGQKIEVISADHQNKPDLATSIARRWYEVEGVDMITELTTSSVALAVHELSKQMKKIGIVKGGQKLAGLLLTLAEVHGLGLDAAQGLVLTEGFYWDHDDKTREFSDRFFKRTGRMPNMIQAGTYSATLQYLKAVKAANTKDTEAVAAKLKELPVDDMFAQGGKVLANGRMVHDLYLFEVKKPSESKKPWDYYKQLAVVPGDKAFVSAKDSGCPLTK